MVTLYCDKVPYVIEETKEAALYFAQDFNFWRTLIGDDNYTAEYHSNLQFTNS